MKKILLFLAYAGVINIFSIMQLAYASDNNIESIINKQTRQIKNLASRVETLENSLFDTRNELAALKNSSSKGKNLHSDLVSNPSNPNNQTDQETESTNHHGEFKPKQDIVVAQDKQDYDLALANLKEGKFSLAEQKFSEFINNHPESKLQSNANFWYAESLYHQGMHNKAAIHYLKGYKKYPKGVKASDSLLKLSYTLNTLGRQKEACGMLDKLEKEFPNRSIDSIKRAKDAKTKFHCN